MKSTGVGVIGCGVISRAYLTAARHFPGIEVRGVADLRPEAAQALGGEFSVRAMPMQALLADPAIEIVLNLTIPRAHAEVGLAAIEAGKHLYLEKPLAVSVAEARQLMAAARSAGVSVGCAPDTFLGGSHQTARAAIDNGVIGRPIAGTATLMLAGHERWHPNPDFYYDRVGGGPMLDMGPYYITDIVNLLGPIREVSAFGVVGRRERVIGKGPRGGQTVPVDCITHIAGTMRMESDAVVQIATSFEVWAHRHTPIEIYGTEGSLLVPDPNRFDGEVQHFLANGAWEVLPTTHGYADGNYRSLGLADMANGLRHGRPPRASGELAFHVLEVMEALIVSADGGGIVKIDSRCARPEPLPPGLAVGELA